MGNLIFLLIILKTVRICVELKYLIQIFLKGKKIIQIIKGCSLGTFGGFIPYCWISLRGVKR